jgi:hypothetical protein
LQKKANSQQTYEGEGEDLKGPDQQPTLYVSPTKIPQPTFNNEFGEGNEEQLQHSQLEQAASKRYFFHDFDDPIANFWILSSSMNVKIFMSEEGHLIICSNLSST